MKNKKISAIILVVLTIVITYIITKGHFHEIINVIIYAKIKWILLGLLLYIIYLLLHEIPFRNFVKLYKQDIKYSYMFYIIVVTNFFNGITPLASGGQPLQVYELHKANINTIDATNAVIQYSIIYHIALILFTVFAILLNNIFNLFNPSKVLMSMTYIGLLLNILLSALFIMISFSKNFNKRLVRFTIKILNKLHIIKDKNKSIEKWDKYCLDFYINSKSLLKNKGLLIGGTIILFIAFLFYYAIPFCMANALGLYKSIPLFTSILLCSHVFLASNYLPIPGATGGTEYAFLSYYGLFIKGFKLNAMLILWRFITYYLPTILGGIVFGFNSSRYGTKKKDI